MLLSSDEFERILYPLYHDDDNYSKNIAELFHEDANFTFCKNSLCLIRIPPDNIGIFIEGVSRSADLHYVQKLVFTLSFNDWSVAVRNPRTIAFLKAERSNHGLIRNCVPISLLISLLSSLTLVLNLPYPLMICLTGSLLTGMLFYKFMQRERSVSSRLAAAERRRDEILEYVSITETFGH